MKDILKTNKWARFKKRMMSRGREEAEIVEYLELLERQVQTLDAALNKLQATFAQPIVESMNDGDL